MNAVAEFKAGDMDVSTQAIMFDFGMIEKMNDLAKMMATSKVAVPKHFQNSPGDCLAVVMQSVQWGMNPFAVAQKCFSIGGTLGYEAQLVAAVINSKAPITSRLQYEWFGDWTKVIGNIKEVPRKGNPAETYRKLNTTVEDEDGCGVRVWATLKGEAEPRVLELLLVQAGTRNSTLWADDPKQQLAYLATKRWSRLYCPEVILGVYTPDEIEEAPPAEKNMGSAEVIKTTRADQIKSKLSGTTKAAPTQPAEVVPSVDEVVTKVMEAEDMSQISAAIEFGRHLPDSERDPVRKAIEQRKKELKTIAEQAEKQQQSSMFSRESVVKALSEAKDIDALATAADMISGAPSEDQDSLRSIYEQRLAEME